MEVRLKRFLELPKEMWGFFGEEKCNKTTNCDINYLKEKKNCKIHCDLFYAHTHQKKSELA